MPKVLIWDYNEIARDSDAHRVPDSKMRQGETKKEWMLRMLLRDLQALAADADAVIRAYDSWPAATDDLANDFDLDVKLASQVVEEGLITQAMLEKTEAVLAKISEMSDSHDPSLWTHEGLRTKEEWAVVRHLAKEALVAMGYRLEPPPPHSMCRWQPPNHSGQNSLKTRWC